MPAPLLFVTQQSKGHKSHYHEVLFLEFNFDILMCKNIFTQSDYLLDVYRMNFFINNNN